MDKNNSTIKVTLLSILAIPVGYLHEQLATSLEKQDNRMTSIHKLLTPTHLHDTYLMLYLTKYFIVNCNKSACNMAQYSN